MPTCEALIDPNRYGPDGTPLQRWCQEPATKLLRKPQVSVYVCQRCREALDRDKSSRFLIWRSEWQRDTKNFNPDPRPR